MAYHAPFAEEVLGGRSLSHPHFNVCLRKAPADN